MIMVRGLRDKKRSESLFSFSKDLVTVKTIVCAGLSCCSTICQQKSMYRVQMLQRTRKPAFATAFIAGRFIHRNTISLITLE